MSLQTCDVYHDFILVLTHCHVSMNVVNTVVIYLIFNMANAPPPLSSFPHLSTRPLSPPPSPPPSSPTPSPPFFSLPPLLAFP